MDSHDKQNYANLPEAVKFRDEFRSFRNNFVNECGDSSCAGGSCDNSGKETVAEEDDLTSDDYIDPETNLEIGESCCGGGKKKNNKKSKWMPFWAKKNKKGKVEEALETLKRHGYTAVLNEVPLKQD